MNSWNCFRANPQHTGRSDSHSIYTPKLLWQVEKYSGQVEEVLIDQNNLYVPDGEGCSAFDLNTGTKKWFFEALNSVHGLALNNSLGTLYFCDGDFQTYAVDIDDGTQKWVFKNIDFVAGYPTVGKTNFIYLGVDNFLYVLECTTGDLIWKFTTDGLQTTILHTAGIAHGPAIDRNNTLYFGSDDYKVYALDSFSGAVKWKQELTGPVSSAVTIGEEGLLFCVLDWQSASVAALSQSGQLLWTFQTGQKVFGSLAVDKDNTSYVGTEDGNLIAITVQGEQKWLFQTSGSFTYAPSLTADGVVYASCSNGSLYAINSDGTLLWDFELGDELSSSPVIGENKTIYLVSRNGKIFAVTEQ